MLSTFNILRFYKVNDVYKIYIYTVYICREITKFASIYVQYVYMYNGKK